MNVQIAREQPPRDGSGFGRSRKRPTLVSLARELGVSRQTVSNVINAPELVKPETRARVQAAITASGYRPSALGRALRSNRSMVIALRVHPMTDEINGTVMDRFLHALTTAAQEASYRITLFTAPDGAAELTQLEALRAINAIDACVLTDTTLDDPRPALLQGLGCPFVAFGRPWSAPPGTHAWVDVDGAAGTEAATRMLMERGHTRIGFIGWGRGSGTGDDRRSGWRRALAAAGVPDAPNGDADAWSVEVEDSVLAGARAAAALRRRGMTAVVCASDSLALGAFPAFTRPDDLFVPVVGFDDTPVARAVGLSSVAQPVEETARLCVATLITLLTRPDVHPADHQRLLLPTLAVRERAAI